MYLISVLLRTQVHSWHLRQRTDASRDATLAAQHIVVPPHNSSTINQQQVAAVSHSNSTINQQQVAALARDVIYTHQQMAAVSRNDGSVQTHNMVNCFIGHS